MIFMKQIQCAVISFKTQRKSFRITKRENCFCFSNIIEGVFCSNFESNVRYVGGKLRFNLLSGTLKWKFSDAKYPLN